jgi:hypothetical protein
MSTIVYPSGTTVLIRQSNNDIQSSIDGNSWSNLTWPISVINSNPFIGTLFIKFITDLTLTSTSQYFICASDSIQFGSDTLNIDGSKPIVNINANYYDGFIENGSSSVNGFSNISIYNLHINGGSYSTQINGGWVAKIYFGYNATNIYVINCSSSGTIAGGGIAGAYVTGMFIGCSSSGIIDNNAGGIVGPYAISISCDACWSTGLIQGGGAGGIVGHWCDNASITNCYSTGAITGPYDGGGIVGDSAGQGNAGCTIVDCFSLGTIQASNGGIAGAVNAPSGKTCVITIINCYSAGSMVSTTQNAGAILAAVNPYAAGNWVVQLNNCYASGNNAQSTGYIVGNRNTENGTDAQGHGTTVYSTNYSEAYHGGNGWSDTNANTVLSDPPSSQTLSTTWFSIAFGQPYKLFNFGYSPYSLTNIAIFNGAPDLVRTASSSVTMGSSTGVGTASTYSLFYGTPSYTGITIDNLLGMISTTSQTSAGVYTLYIVNANDTYNMTVFTLTVTLLCFLKGTQILCVNDEMSEYKKIEDLKRGDMVKTYLHGAKAVDIVGHMTLQHSRQKNARNQLCVYKKDKIYGLTEDLVLTGGHSVLVDNLTESEKTYTMVLLGNLYHTDDKMRLMACLDSRAVPFDKEESAEEIYHLCLEHSNPEMNYGVWANGMLVETSQKSVMEKWL